MPDLLASQVQMCSPYIGQELFGLDALTEDGKNLKEPVRRFVDCIVNTNWSRLRARLNNKREKVNGLQKVVEEKFEGAATSLLLLCIQHLNFPCNSDR
jgi:hypothetical protein